MKRCPHKLALLCPPPTTVEGRLQHLFCPYPDYLVCTLCGRIGWYTRYARKLAWLRREDEERVRGRAVDWNAAVAVGKE